jgi:hypothetical protein
MIWAVTILTRWGVAQRFAKPLAIALAIAAAIALLAAAWAIWLHKHDAGVIEQHETEITDKINAISTEAAASASVAVDHSRNQVELGNEQARAAASDSPDPLRAGFDRLRQGKGSDQPAAR